MPVIYGLVGFPLGHSGSADYFNRRFREEGPEDAVYRLFSIPSLNDLPTLVRENPELSGFNVTIPYKQAVMEFLGELDPLAREIGAVNLVLITRTGGTIRMKGFNTDAPAFQSTLQTPMAHKAALVLGSGGASQAVSWVLRNLGMQVLIVSRDPKGTNAISYPRLLQDPAILASHTLVVNTTPLGMFPDTDSCPALPYEQLTRKNLLYDVVYNPGETLFLKKGRERGAQTLSGQQMFLAQAALGYHLFTGR